VTINNDNPAPNVAPVSPPSITLISLEANLSMPVADVSLDLTNNGGASITARGVVYATHTAPTLSDHVDVDGGTSTGPFTMVNANFSATALQTTYVRGYATNAGGLTGYSNETSFIPQLCLVAGTLITLADGSAKPIEEITYADQLLVWDFDIGAFASAKPLWIAKQGRCGQYNHLRFANGAELKTVSQHRIFNAQSGAFTYPMTDDTPVGTTTATLTYYRALDFIMDSTTLVSKEIVKQETDYYNIITDYHINLFANGILTSCRYSNLYPIVDLRYQRTNTIRDDQYPAEYARFVKGLRMPEQPYSRLENIAYIQRLLANEKDNGRGITGLSLYDQFY
jgi:hypothetical protein